MKRGIIAGNFDVLHPGYIKMFNHAKSKCDKLIVLLHDDPSYERPEKLKPILSYEERKEMLLSLEAVDEVFLYLTEKGLVDLIKIVKPDIRFLGDDYIDMPHVKPYTGSELNIPIGWIKRDHGWSTTKYKRLITESYETHKKKKGQAKGKL